MVSVVKLGHGLLCGVCWVSWRTTACVNVWHRVTVDFTKTERIVSEMPCY